MYRSRAEGSLDVHTEAGQRFQQSLLAMLRGTSAPTPAPTLGWNAMNIPVGTSSSSSSTNMFGVGRREDREGLQAAPRNLTASASYSTSVFPPLNSFVGARGISASVLSSTTQARTGISALDSAPSHSGGPLDMSALPPPTHNAPSTFHQLPEARVEAVSTTSVSLSAPVAPVAPAAPAAPGFDPAQLVEFLDAYMKERERKTQQQVQSASINPDPSPNI